MVRISFLGVAEMFSLLLLLASCSGVTSHKTDQNSQASAQEIQEYKKYPVIQDIINSTLN